MKRFACLVLLFAALSGCSKKQDAGTTPAPPAQGGAMPASGSPVALQHIEKHRAMGDAFRAGRLPAPAPLPEGDIDTQAARLAQAVSAGDAHSTAALVAALSAAGYGIRRADGKIGGAARGGQGMAFDEWQVAAMAKLYGQDYGVPLDRLAGAFVRNVPEFKAAPLASMLVEGIRAGAQAEDNPPLRFWAQFIVELGRYSDHPYDLLNPVTPVTVRLDAVQTQLILMRLAGDLAVLEQRGARHSADAGAHFLLASFAEPLRAGSFLVAPEPQAGPPCGSTTDAENLIFDTTATATTTAFGQVTEFLSKNGFGGLGSYANGATRAGLVLTVLKFISTYAALDVKISMDGKLLTRTKNTNAGERRKLTATVRSNTGNWQMINCLRPALNLAGLDFSLPGDGPVANVKVTWNLVEGGGPEGLVASVLDTATHLDDIYSNKDYDTGAIVYLDTAAGKKEAEKEYYTFTDGEGQSSIYAVGAAQKEDLALKGAVSVFKHATVTVSVQAKPVKFKDATAAASTLGDATANVIQFLSGDLPGATVSFVTETALRSQWYSPDPFTFDVRDWEPCSGGWTGTITVERRLDHTETATGQDAWGPWVTTSGNHLKEKTSCDLFTTGDPQRSEGTCRMREEYEEVSKGSHKGTEPCSNPKGGPSFVMTAQDSRTEKSTTGGGAGQSGAVFLTSGDHVVVSADPIKFNTFFRDSQTIVSGCPTQKVWGPYYANWDNRLRMPQSLGGVNISVKLNQLKGTRTDTIDDGIAIAYTTYTWDLKPCGAKRGE